MIDKILLNNKLLDETRYLEELKEVLLHDTEAIIEDFTKLHTVERLIQLIVDTAVAINMHIIRTEDLAVVKDYRTSFLKIADHGVISKLLAVKISASVGLRNMLVHQYGDVDMERVVKDLKKEIKQYHDYIKAVDKWVSK